MNISESFADFLATETGSTLGQDLFISAAPSSNKVQDSIWWTVATGGNIETEAVTAQSIKSYSVEIYYRSRNYKQVFDKLQQLEITLNCSSCIELEDYQVIQARAQILSIDSDLDNVDRKVGLLQAEIKVYADCN